MPQSRDSNEAEKKTIQQTRDRKPAEKKTIPQSRDSNEAVKQVIYFAPSFTGPYLPFHRRRIQKLNLFIRNRSRYSMFVARDSDSYLVKRIS